MKAIPIPRFMVKPLLWVTNFINDNFLLLVCKGYDEDDENYTGLYWDEDKDLAPSDTNYFDFQLWINYHFPSHCWAKLKSLIYCAVSWNGKHNEKSELLKVQSFDFIESDTLIQEIKNDYEFIREKLKTQGFSALTGKDGKWIQARTKGAGHGSTSRAFYARKELIKEIIKI